MITNQDKLGIVRRLSHDLMSGKQTYRFICNNTLSLCDIREFLTEELGLQVFISYVPYTVITVDLLYNYNRIMKLSVNWKGVF